MAVLNVGLTLRRAPECFRNSGPVEIFDRLVKMHRSFLHTLLIVSLSMRRRIDRAGRLDCCSEKYWCRAGEADSLPGKKEQGDSDPADNDKGSGEIV